MHNMPCKQNQSFTVWITGLSASGKTTLATGLQDIFQDKSVFASVLDGDVLRTGLNKDLDYSDVGRSESIRRAAEVARLLNDVGVLVIAALISPLRKDREIARSIIGPERFFEVHVSTPLAVCEARDPKGLYAQARAGKIEHFTGISAPYEEPDAPCCCIDTTACSIETSLTLLHEALQSWRSR